MTLSGEPWSSILINWLLFLSDRCTLILLILNPRYVTEDVPYFIVTRMIKHNNN